MIPRALDRVTRLVAVFTLLLVLLLLGGGWVFHALLERGFQDASRRELREQAALIQRALESHDDGPAAAWQRLDPEALRFAAGLDRLELFGPRGKALHPDPLWDLPAAELPDTLIADLHLGLEFLPPPQRVGDELFQIYYLPLRVDGELEAILLIESGEAVSAQLQTLRRGLWWATGLGAAFVAFMLFAMAGILGQARRRQRELDRAEHLAEVGTLAAGLAHEIRNPLAIIAGNAELFELEAEGEKAARRADDILGETERLQRLLEEFMNFARPTDLKRSRVELVEIWRRALDEQAALHPNLRFDFESAAKLPPLQADPDRLRQLALNLLANAARAARKTVSVRVERRGEELHCRVADDGPGVPAEILPRLFEPFATGSEGGTGLGLAVCAGVARAHGGRLLLSENDETGAVFTLDLPLKEQA
jgi:signal transduction histidine kinase